MANCTVSSSTCRPKVPALSVSPVMAYKLSVHRHEYCMRLVTSPQQLQLCMQCLHCMRTSRSYLHRIFTRVVYRRYAI